MGVVGNGKVKAGVDGARESRYNQAIPKRGAKTKVDPSFYHRARKMMGLDGPPSSMPSGSPGEGKRVRPSCERPEILPSGRSIFYQDVLTQERANLRNMATVLDGLGHPTSATRYRDRPEVYLGGLLLLRWEQDTEGMSEHEKERAFQEIPPKIRKMISLYREKHFLKTNTLPRPHRLKPKIELMPEDKFEALMSYAKSELKMPLIPKVGTLVDKIRKEASARISEGSTIEDLKKAIKGASADIQRGSTFHQNRNLVYVWGSGYPLYHAMVTNPVGGSGALFYRTGEAAEEWNEGFARAAKRSAERLAEFANGK